MGQIKTLLLDIGAITEDDIEVFSECTRDQDNLTVYRDRRSGVIFIDDFYVGEQEYSVGDYREKLAPVIGIPDWEHHHDTARRVADFERFFVGKDVVDFGCGQAQFLQAIRANSKTVFGVEIDQSCLRIVEENGIRASDSLQQVPDNSIDTVVCFHVLEHLPDPVKMLREMRRVLKPGGILVVEVPHARDFLLVGLGSEAYKTFTLWSQHLVLHTRASLESLLAYVGFTSFLSKAVQRYPLSNHIGWLTQGRPGGHKSQLSTLDTVGLTHEYEAALAKLEMTDTLTLVAQKSID